MAFGSTTVFEIQTGGSDGTSGNGGGFDPGNANMATDLAAKSPTSVLPFVYSASYSWKDRDVNHWLFTKTGTNWRTGWFKIVSTGAISATIAAGGASYTLNDILTLSGGTSTTAAQFKVTGVSGGVITAVSFQTAGAYSVQPSNPVSVTGGTGSSATLTVTWGANVNAVASSRNTDGTYAVTSTSWVDSSTRHPGLNQGVATGSYVADTASGTWSVDYSQTGAAGITFTDMVIGGTNTQFTSSGNPVGKNYVGNLIAVSSGAPFTTQRVEVNSVSGTTATCDKALGTAGSTGGNGIMGGALASPGYACSVGGGASSGSPRVWLQSGTYIVSSSSNNVAGGIFTPPAGNGAVSYVGFVGYGTIRGDRGTKPQIKSAVSSVTVANGATAVEFENLEIGLSAGTETSVSGMNDGIVKRCKFSSLNIGVTSTSACVVFYCEFASCTTGVSFGGLNGSGSVLASTFTSCTTGLSVVGGYGSCNQCLFISCTTATTGGSLQQVSSCTAYNCGVGFKATSHHAVIFNCVTVSCTSEAYSSNNTGYVSVVNCADYNSSTVFPTGATSSENTDGFITLTADPFTNAAGNDFTLNNTSGGGASLRAAGYLSFPGLSTISSPDIGASQVNATSVDPSVANVRSGTAYTINGSALTGTLVVPAPGGVGFRGGFTNG